MTIAIEFLENKVVKIEILIKNIGTGGTPAIAKIETRANTLIELTVVIACNELKNTTFLRLKFNRIKTKFKKEIR